MRQPERPTVSRPEEQKRIEERQRLAGLQKEIRLRDVIEAGLVIVGSAIALLGGAALLRIITR